MAENPDEPQTAKPLAIDHQAIRDLAQLLDETGLTEIEFQRDGVSIRVGRHGYSSAGRARPAEAAALAPAAVTREDGQVQPAQHPGTVASPMVGTVYLGPAPGARPFIEIGSGVKAGDTLLIIEAMKTMNQVPAPRAGVVTQILFEDAQPVEFGEPLVIVE